MSPCGSHSPLPRFALSEVKGVGREGDEKRWQSAFPSQGLCRWVGLILIVCVL